MVLVPPPNSSVISTLTHSLGGQGSNTPLQDSDQQVEPRLHTFQESPLCFKQPLGQRECKNDSVGWLGISGCWPLWIPF